jgi:hypothetical protein
MVNRYHLAILDLARHAILTDPRSTSPLPIITAPGRTRAVVWLSRWMHESKIHGALLWSWLGRANATLTECDWLLVVNLDPGEQSMSSLQWNDISSADAPGDEYQQLALRIVREAIASPGIFGPYANPVIWPTLASFVQSSCTETATGTGPGLEPIEQHRYKVTPTRLVASYRCVRDSERTVFLKGCVDPSSNERAILSHLREIAPWASARVLAQHADLGLLLLDEAGPALGRTTDCGVLERVMMAFADLQHQWAMAAAHAPSVTTFTHETSWQAVARFLCRGGSAQRASTDSLRTAARRAWERLADDDEPLSLIHIDPTVNNVRVDGDEVRFIDFEHAIVGPAPLACELILARFEHAHHSWPNALSDHLRMTYAARWARLLGRPRVSRCDEGLRLLAQLLVAATHWRVLCERLESGEWSGPLDAVWLKAITRLSASVRTSEVVS